MAATERPVPPSATNPTGRLDSWKEIAAHLQRSERTVRRWEHTLGLPIHRLSGSKRATVFALESELADWWLRCGENGSRTAAAEDTAPKPRWRAGLFIAGALAVTAALALVGMTMRRTPVAAPASWKQITFDSGSTLNPVITRDGKWIVYSSDRSGRGDHDIYAQRLSGGEPMRLTEHAARDCRPDVSPDGSRVVFHSYRDGGGIYVMPLIGGHEKRIADGDYPRFSPDGSRVAFDRDLADGTFAVFTAPAEGGPATRMTPPAFRRARVPLWSPDGNHILFIGSVSAEPRDYDDWWAVSAGGGAPIRTGVTAQLLRQGLRPLRFFHGPEDWLGNAVVFPYSDGGGVNVWRIPLSVATWKADGRAEPLTSGMGRESEIRIATGHNGRHLAVATAGVREVQLWEFAIEPENGVVTGEGRRLIADASVMPGLSASRPSLSKNGDTLVYAARRGGNYDVWRKDLVTGVERPLASGPLDEVDPILSPDGASVAFVRPDGARRPIFVISIRSGQIRRVCDDCGTPTDWSPDGNRLLCVSTDEKLALVDVQTGARLELPSTVPVMSGTFSPDGRAVAIGARVQENERAYLVPFDHGEWGSPGRWILLSGLQASAVTWSPRGELAYFLSLEDEYRCLWARRVDLRSRRPVGSPFAVKHFHTMRQYPQMLRWVGIARNRLVLRLTHENANIWLAELD